MVMLPPVQRPDPPRPLLAAQRGWRFTFRPPKLLRVYLGLWCQVWLHKHVTLYGQSYCLVIKNWVVDIWCWG